MTFAYSVEECRADAWKFRFEDTDAVMDHLRATIDLDVDTDNMLLWHQADVKISFVPRSGVLMVRTVDRDEAERIVEDVFPD